MQVFDEDGRLKVSLGTVDELIDADGDTYVRVEQAPDEDIIRFGTGGVERATIGATGIFSFQEYLTHLGDANTYLRFTPDRLRVEVGGVDILDIIPGAVVWNEGEADVDFKVGANGIDAAFFVEGSSGNALVDGTLHADGRGVIEGDATGGRVTREIILLIEDGTNVNTLKCTVSSEWNGDTIAVTDNVAKGFTTGNFTLDATGQTLKIEAAGLSGNCVSVFGILIYNSSTVDSTPWITVVANDINIQAYRTSDGAIRDITALVDLGGGTLRMKIRYKTVA